MDRIDLLLAVIYLLLLVTIGLTVCSVVRSIRMGNGGDAVSNGVPVARIAWLTAGAVVVLLVLTFALGSTHPLTINGRLFQDGFWLRVSDMFINTSLVLILLAVGAVGFGLSGWSRKLKRLGKKK